MNKNKTYHPDTLAVRGGLSRSQFDETSEALYLTSGYVYSSAQEAADSFSGDLDRFVYRSRLEAVSISSPARASQESWRQFLSNFPGASTPGPDWP